MEIRLIGKIIFRVRHEFVHDGLHFSKHAPRDVLNWNSGDARCRMRFNGKYFLTFRSPCSWPDSIHKRACGRIAIRLANPAESVRKARITCVSGAQRFSSALRRGMPELVNAS
jgi:hypothetical protein